MAVKITNLGMWERYTPDPVPPEAPAGAAFARRPDDGQDWYALAHNRNSFPAGALLATAIPVSRADGVSGFIVQAVQRREDVSKLFPAGGYLVQIEGVPETEEKPHKLFEQQNFDPVAETIEPFPPLPGPPVITFKADIWRRCTDVEADALDADLKAQPARIQRLFGDAQHIDHADPLFDLMRGAITARFGEERAAEILAPS
jgi:hypothetical protein